MTLRFENAMNDLNSTVSFGGGGGGSGGGDRGGRRDRRATAGERAQRTQDRFNDMMSGAIGVIGDAVIGNPGDNPDMGAMSDANRGQNSRPSFSFGGGGRGGGSGR